MASTKQPSSRRFIALPPRGVRLMHASSTPELVAFFDKARPGTAAVRARAAGSSVNMRVLDAIDGNGARLIEGSDADILALREQNPGLRLVPIVYYHPALQRFHV